MKRKDNRKLQKISNKTMGQTILQRAAYVNLDFKLPKKENFKIRKNIAVLSV